VSAGRIRVAVNFGAVIESAWVRMQASYDLAQARKDESKIKVRHQPVPRELHVH
jgi:plasmid maintenance system antidote protein VapI